MENLEETLDLVPEEAFAALRGIGVPTLRNNRSAGEPVEFVKLGKKILYPRRAVEQFIKTNTVAPAKAHTLVHGPTRTRRRAHA
jgi:hypothetical protein